MKDYYDILFTILFGWLGYWRFKRGQFALGVLYLFTGGLCTFGWFYDIYQCFKILIAKKGWADERKIEESKKKFNDAAETLKLLDRIPGKYMGGLADLSKIKDMTILVTENNLEMKISAFRTIKVKMEDIVNVQVMTAEAIHRDVTLTRMVLFGGFAFGMKKRKMDKEQFVVITYNDFGMTHNLIIETKKPQKLQSNIMIAKRRNYNRNEIN